MEDIEVPPLRLRRAAVPARQGEGDSHPSPSAAVAPEPPQLRPESIVRQTAILPPRGHHEYKAGNEFPSPISAPQKHRSRRARAISPGGSEFQTQITTARRTPG